MSRVVRSSPCHSTRSIGSTADKASPRWVKRVRLGSDEAPTVMGEHWMAFQFQLLYLFNRWTPKRIEKLRFIPIVSNSSAGLLAHLCSIFLALLYLYLYIYISIYLYVYIYMVVLQYGCYVLFVISKIGHDHDLGLQTIFSVLFLLMKGRNDVNWC
jgi:hypothetical protein